MSGLRLKQGSEVVFRRREALGAYVALGQPLQFLHALFDKLALVGFRSKTRLGKCDYLLVDAAVRRYKVA